MVARHTVIAIAVRTLAFTFLKEFEILSVFMRFLTHVFNLFTAFYVFIFTCSAPLLCFVSFTVP